MKKLFSLIVCFFVALSFNVFALNAYTFGTFDYVVKMSDEQIVKGEKRIFVSIYNIRRCREYFWFFDNLREACYMYDDLTWDMDPDNINERCVKLLEESEFSKTPFKTPNQGPGFVYLGKKELEPEVSEEAEIEETLDE